jgi:hypothetical protein
LQESLFDHLVGGREERFRRLDADARSPLPTPLS